MRWLVVGGGAREHAIADTLARAGAEIAVASANANPGLDRLAATTARLDPTSAERVVEFARRARAEAAVVGPEAPLARGVADALRAAGVPTVGPDRAAARLESSKAFARDLLARHGVGGQPRTATVGSVDAVDAALAAFPGPFVVKPDALTAGKGVWVQGADFAEPREAAAYAKSILVQGGQVVLEEKLDGEEFSLMAFVTDSGIYPMPLVQDFKRALEGNQGGNTGGMGSYSQRDHLLPFVPPADRDRALEILAASVAALKAEGLSFRGVLYGGFMLTAGGPRLLEYNVRFGDPEAMNVLALYEEGNFSELLAGVATGRVDPTAVRFRPRATVVKYLVPPGYGAQPRPGGVLTVDEEKIRADGVRVYYGSVEAAGPTAVRLESGRGIALVGEASAIFEAGVRVEAALRHVRGDYYVRHDIGTKDDLARRTQHMRTLLVPGAKPSPLPLSVAPADAPPSSSAPAWQRVG